MLASDSPAAEPIAARLEGGADGAEAGMRAAESLPGQAGAPAVSPVQKAIEEWGSRLRAVRDAWEAALPPGAASEWPLGLVYVRESYGASLVGDAPDSQLKGVLSLFAQKQIYVPPDGVYFDVKSGTDIRTRGDFQRLFERAIGGGFQAVGAYLNERMFRNVEQAKQVKRQFRLHGVEFMYVGMYEGDQRNPSAWFFDTMQDAQAELHARNTSALVGRHFEFISRAGRPIGHLPEVYRVKTRAPGLFGRRGSVIEWETVEPLESVIREGCRRYLAGASLSELAAWSATTELGGVTPKGRVMDKPWWYNTLTNPKLAGFQRPTNYVGYKPRVETQARPRRARDAELVPCLLPALWTLETYHDILRTAHARSRAPKLRRTYQKYLLSSIAVSAECGHSMRVGQRHKNGRWSMKCGVSTTAHGQLPERRADIAAAELDEIIGLIHLEDDGLHRQIEEELREISRAEAQHRRAFRANPAIAAVRQAIAALGPAGMSDVRADLARRLRELEDEDELRRESLSEPLVDFRHAMAQLKNWTEVWHAAETWKKNTLLREAGIKAVLGTDDGDEKGPLHLVSVTSSNPVFALALGAVLSGCGDWISNGPVADPMVAIPSVLPLPIAALESVRRLGMEDGPMRIRRPRIVRVDGRSRRPPLPLAGSWFTLAEVAAAVGLSHRTVFHHVETGHLAAIRHWAGSHGWWLVQKRDLERFLADRAGAVRRAA